MRDYARIAPTFWTGDTGREIRRRGSEAVIVAVYLMTSPHSNMLGLYYQPKLYMAHETGLGIEGAEKGLAHCIEAGFCAYDAPTEFVWVFEMASFQIAPQLKADDKRCKGIQKDYDALPRNPFLPGFFDRYSCAFHLSNKRVVASALQGPSQAPSYAPSKQGEGTGTGTGEGTGSQAAYAALPPASLPAGSPTAQAAVPPAPVAPLVLSEQVPSIPPCPVQQLVKLFALKCPTLPKPRSELWKDSAGAEAMRQRWKWLLSAEAIRDDQTRYASNAAEALDWFGRFFDAVNESDFLSGRNGAWSNCDLAWLMKRENFMKVVQGNYRNKDKGADA